ncbi:universal stress protein [Streptomyces fuscichromogenes]|uniref:universal stress protein n=1 Tax=Streptomyces fuscichromogenes TaxID=1324013 RepID=UPI00381E6A73
MTRTVIVGLDGSPESRAAAEWAAREAELLEQPLKLVHVREPAPTPMAQAPLLGPETQQHWTEQIPREAAEGLRLRHPGLDVSTEQVSGRPADAHPGPGQVRIRVEASGLCHTDIHAAHSHRPVKPNPSFVLGEGA